MIEIPEADVLARQFNTVFPGKAICHVEAAKAPHKFAWFFRRPGIYPGLLNGKRWEMPGPGEDCWKSKWRIPGCFLATASTSATTPPVPINLPAPASGGVRGRHLVQRHRGDVRRSVVLP